MMRQIAILWGFIWVLAACAPNLPPQQTALSAASLGLGPEPAPAVDMTWWHALHDPALDQLMEDALAKNPSLAEAQARLEAAKAALSSARSEEYPHLDFNGQELREQLSSRYIIPPPYGGSTRWLGDVEGDLSWDIDLWGREAALVDKAKALRYAARLDSDGARLAIESALASAYVAFDGACRLDAIARQSVNERTQTLALTGRRLKSGLDSQVEKSEAAALLDSAREQEKAADANREISVHEIAALSGHGADAYAGIVCPAQPLDASLPLPEALPADLLARRPDILASEARIQAALSGREAARTAFYPNVNLLGVAGFSALGLGNLFTGNAAQYGGGAAVHLPIFDAGALRANYHEASADLDLAIADYNGAVLAAVRDTADHLTQIRSLDARTAESAQFLRDSEEGYRLAQSRYRSGLANQLTLLDAEALVLQARDEHVTLEWQRTSARIDLVLAIGGGFSAAARENQQVKAHE
jgi:NodT family efflux transporter outer membrane factor (OMF) lipoprotein